MALTPLPELTISERLGASMVGVVAGVVYGTAISVGLFFHTGEFHGSIIVLAMLVFGGVSFFYDNFGFDAFLIVITLTAGFANGVDSNNDLL